VSSYELLVPKTSTQYQLVVFAMHGITFFDSSSSIPLVLQPLHSKYGNVSFNTTGGREVGLAYFAPHHGGDSVTYPRNYIPIAPEFTGQWFYTGFKILGQNNTSPTQKRGISPRDDSDVMGDALVRG